MGNDSLMERTSAWLTPSSHFLKDGIWWITVVCPVCGMVDEQVEWIAARTPRHAGALAEARHAEHAQVDADHDVALAGLAEISSAEDLLANQARNYERWVARVDALRQLVKERPDLARELAAAEAQAERHKHGLVEAQRRVADTIASNRGSGAG